MTELQGRSGRVQAVTVEAKQEVTTDIFTWRCDAAHLLRRRKLVHMERIIGGEWRREILSAKLLDSDRPKAARVAISP